MVSVRIFITLMVFASLARSLPAQADWQYVPKSAGLRKGTLTTTTKDGATYVSMRQFCFALGCRVLYQWANHRAIIQNWKNPAQKLGAIVSSITRIAIID